MIEKVYSPPSSRKSLIWFYIVGTVFIAVGVLMFTQGELVGAMITIGFIGLIFLLLELFNPKRHTRYIIRPNYLTLRARFIRPTEILWKDIARIDSISISQGEELLLHKRNEFDPSMVLSKGFKALKEAKMRSNQIRNYIGVHVVKTQVNGRITSMGLKYPLVHIETIDGDEFLITPEEKEEFLMHVRKKMNR